MEAKALVVDLTTRQTQVQEFPQRYIEQYLGGRGLGARLLHDYIEPTVEPLAPENALIFLAGPLHATRAYYSSKSIIYTKSPLTGTTMYSIASGSLCHQLAKCGYSALIIKGKAEQPTYVSVRDGRVELKDATKTWGLNTEEAEYFIRENIPAEASLALIGPAGENLVKFACVVTEGFRHQAFGRGGIGAVMGSKNLKAVAILGTGEIPVADPAALKVAQRALLTKLSGAPEFKAQYRRYGTPGSLPMLNTGGILPTRQWYTGQFKDIDWFEPERLHEEWTIDNHNCGPYCPNPCFHWMRVRDGEYRGALSFGPEYETVYAFGSNLDNRRFDSIIAADKLCDLLGLDTISAGLTIGWAFESAERGLLGNGKADGLDLHFGNHAVINQLLYKMAYREGIGDLLAEGSQKASAIVGGGSDAWAMTAKGMEFGGYECRASWGQALQFALSHRGGCHHDLGLPARKELGTPQATRIEGQGEFVKSAAVGRISYDCAIMCTFPLSVLGLDIAGGLMSAVTGRNLDVPALHEIGERIINVERLFNVKAGFGRAADRLPDRLLKDPLPDGPGKGHVVPLEPLKDEFYRAAGWDLETGVPTGATLERLGIEPTVWYPVE